jgi:hypothetical protein
MAVLNLYSKRQRAAANAGKLDVYKYNQLPQPLRVQIVHLWRDLFGIYNRHGSGGEAWVILHDNIARERGVLALQNGVGNPQQRCETELLTASTDDALDMIEHSFGGINADYGSPEDAVKELNQRFREHSVGYQFSGGVLIRVDNQFLHAEVIQPALALLGTDRFAAANDEFLLAHRHYRDGKHKDCVVAANRAFETTLKTICRARGWDFNAGDRASELVTVVRNRGLFPSYLDKGLDTYVAMVKTGLPGVRNSAGGHGAEPAAPPVPDYIAAHALHLTAANIVLLVEAFNRG